jgi:hypothetical protein
MRNNGMKPIQLNTPVFCSTVRAHIDRLTIDLYREILSEYQNDFGGAYMKHRLRFRLSKIEQEQANEYVVVGIEMRTLRAIIE